MTLNVIDSHFHIWDPDAQDLPWLAGLPSLQHKYTIEDLAAQYAKFGVNFLGGVYVEVDAADHELEDRLLYENASPLILKRMLQGRVSPWMRVPINADGIREPLHVDSEPRGRALEPEFIAGLRAMAAKGLPFELCNRGPELGDMAKAFSQVPEVTVIIDHLGIVKYVRDTFGPKKVLYSSNWPVVELNSTFATHFQLMLDTFGEDEDFFENNARRAYNID